MNFRCVKQFNQTDNFLHLALNYWTKIVLGFKNRTLDSHYKHPDQNLHNAILNFELSISVDVNKKITAEIIFPASILYSINICLLLRRLQYS